MGIIPSHLFGSKIKRSLKPPVTLVQAPSAQLFVGCICTTAVRKFHNELRHLRVRSDQINFQYLPENPRKLVPEPTIASKKYEAGSIIEPFSFTVEQKI